MATEEQQPTLIVGLDIEDFSGRGMDGQRELQERLERALDDALARLALHVPPAHRKHTGDGTLFLVTGAVNPSAVVADLPRKITNELAYWNRTSTAEARMRLRMVVHFGMVRVGPVAWNGSDIVVAVRLLDCSAGRGLLKDHPTSPLVLLLSPWVYQHSVEERLDGLDPADFQPITIPAGEKGRGQEGWACLGSARSHAHAASASTNPAAPARPGDAAATRTTRAEPSSAERIVSSTGPGSAAFGGDNNGTLNIGRHE